MKTISIYDVAKKANVSASTVSKVINNYSYIKEETKQKVLDAIEVLNFTPNLSAHLLPNINNKKGLRKNCFGFVIPEGSKHSDQFFSKILDGIIMESSIMKCSVITDFVKPDYKDITDLPLIIKEGLVDGIIIAGDNSENFTLKIIDYGVPIVLVESYCKKQELNSVLIDNFNGAFKAVKYLIDCGHRKIGLISSRMDFESTLNRYLGFKYALESSGLKLNEELIEMGYFTYQGGYDAMKRLLERGARPTAVFVMDDYEALGVMKAVEDFKLRIPDDISIIGFDDVESASIIRPGLTTVKVPKEEMGVLAVRKLKELIEGKSNLPSKIVVPVEIAERETVRKLL